MPGVASLAAVQRAVDEFDVSAFQLDIEPAALTAARFSLERAGLLLLGEVHGVRQNPLLARALMVALDVTGLAMEWPADLAGAVGGFLADGQVPDHDQLWGGDGRITVGHFAVLRERFTAVRLEALTLFDGVNEVGWSRREAAMADRILAAPGPAGGTLVVAGNVHTHLNPIGLGVPLGVRLAERRAGVREIRVRYGTGGYYNLTPQRFKHGWTMRRRARLHIEGSGLVLDLPRPVQARVPHRFVPSQTLAAQRQTGQQPVLQQEARPQVQLPGAFTPRREREPRPVPQERPPWQTGPLPQAPPTWDTGPFPAVRPDAGARPYQEAAPYETGWFSR